MKTLNISKAEKLAAEINSAIKPGKKPSMQQIVAEIKAVRSVK